KRIPAFGKSGTSRMAVRRSSLTLWSIVAAWSISVCPPNAGGRGSSQVSVEPLRSCRGVPRFQFDARQEQLHHLGGAFADGQHTGIPEVPFNGVVLAVAIGPVDLQGGVGDAE